MSPFTRTLITRQAQRLMDGPLIIFKINQKLAQKMTAQTILLKENDREDTSEKKGLILFSGLKFLICPHLVG